MLNGIGVVYTSAVVNAEWYVCSAQAQLFMLNGMGVVDTSTVVHAEWYVCSGHNGSC